MPPYVRTGGRGIAAGGSATRQSRQTGLLPGRWCSADLTAAHAYRAHHPFSRPGRHLEQRQPGRPTRVLTRRTSRGVRASPAGSRCAPAAGRQARHGFPLRQLRLGGSSLRWLKALFCVHCRDSAARVDSTSRLTFTRSAGERGNQSAGGSDV